MKGQYVYLDHSRRAFQAETRQDRHGHRPSSIASAIGMTPPYRDEHGNRNHERLPIATRSSYSSQWAFARPVLPVGSPNGVNDTHGRPAGCGWALMCTWMLRRTNYHRIVA